MSKKILMMLICLLSSIGVFAQVSVSGKVVDEDGIELSGANVAVKGTTSGALTDADGKFSISNVPGGENATLVFSYIGYATQEIKIGNQRIFNIKMAEDNQELEEVVVVAYGTAKKKDLTGSMTTLDSKVISVQAQSTVTRALEGQVPGLQASALDGQPGLDVGIRIRGVGTASQNNSNALVIIDGTPAPEGVNILSSINNNDIESVSVLKDAASTALYGSRGANGVLLITTKKGRQGKVNITLDARCGWNTLGANGKVQKVSAGQYYEMMWESIYNAAYMGYAKDESLKGNSSAAAEFASQHLFNYTGSATEFGKNGLGNWMLYDVPGAVYTQTGSIDKTTGKISNTTLSSTMTGAYLVNTDGKLNPNASLIYDDGTWADEVFANRFRQEYNISASGGTDKMDYNFSLGMLSDPSYITWSKFKRYTGRANINAQITNWLKAGANMSYGNRKTESQATRWGRNPGHVPQNVFRWSNATNPLVQAYVRDKDGNYVYENGEKQHEYLIDGVGRSYSPLGYVTAARNMDLQKFFEQSEYSQAYDDVSVKGYLRASFLKHFSAEANLSIDKNFVKLIRFYNAESSSAFIGTSLGGSAIARQRIEYSNMDAQVLLNYNQDFGKHHVDAMLGHEYWQYDMDQMNGGGAHTLVDDFQGYVNFLGTQSYSTFGSTTGGSINKQTLESYIGRANYNYDQKYYLQASLRRDGSSKFKYSKNRWGTFWSLGGGWVLSKENFMGSTKNWLDFLKLRASYGVIGNQNGISLYSGYQTWSYSGSDWAASSSSYPNSTSLSKGSWVNDGLTWEKVNTFDVGLEFTMLNNKLKGTFDFYNRETVNALWAQNTSYWKSGQATLMMNTAKLRNRGFEVELSYDIISNKDWYWQISTNGTHYQTILTELPEGATDPYQASADAWSTAGSGASSGSEMLRGVGKPYYNLYLYKYAGVAGNPGKTYWADATTSDKADDRGKAIFYHQVTAEEAAAGSFGGAKEGDDIMTTNRNLASRYEMGDATPKWIGGFRSDLKYKNFDLTALFSYQLGGKFFSVEYGSSENGQYHAAQNLADGCSISKEVYGNTWNENNVSAKFPALVYGEATSYMGNSANGSWTYSDMALFSASYLSLKNLTIGYTLPEDITKRIGISALRLYASGDNLALLYGHSGIDPRWSLVGGMEVGAYSYAYMKVFNLGLTVTF